MTARTPPPGLTRQERREFVRAYAEHVWAHPGSERPTARLLTVAIVLTIVTVMTVLVGVGLELVFPSMPPATAVPLRTPPATVYTAVSGWDCAGAGDRGFEITGRTAEWRTVATGGWAEDGCHGTFEAIPLSGNDSQETPGQAAVWWFVPGPGYARCELAIYVPKPVRAQDAAATRATYAIRAGRGGGPVGEFVVDQTAMAGKWVSAGTFPSGPEGLAIRIGNRGAPASGDVRLALAQARITCSY